MNEVTEVNNIQPIVECFLTNIIVPIIVSLITTVLVYFITKRLDTHFEVPSLHIRTWNKAEIENNISYFREFNVIVVIHFLEIMIDVDSDSGEEEKHLINIEYNKISIDALSEYNENLVVLNISESKVKGALNLKFIEGKNNHDFRIDEAQVCEFEFSNGNSCFLFSLDDKPFSLKGTYKQIPIIYHLGNNKSDFIRGKLRKKY